MTPVNPLVVVADRKRDERLSQMLAAKSTGEIVVRIPVKDGTPNGTVRVMVEELVTTR